MLISRSRPSGKWTATLAALRAGWERGETSAMMCAGFMFFPVLNDVCECPPVLARTLAEYFNMDKCLVCDKVLPPKPSIEWIDL